MKTIHSIAVFCGSSNGNHPSYSEAAFNTGKAISMNGMKVVYGGARVGLMGKVADGALSAGGEVIGIIPGFLKTKEIAHENLTELITVETMHERKLKMHELSDGIITLPGGYGTMEELFEMLTWAQLGLHAKPTGLLNINGYYDSLVKQIEVMSHDMFLRNSDAQRLIVANDVESLLAMMKTYEAPAAPKWITEETT